MPTPIAHSLAGIALFAARPDRRGRDLALLATVLAAALAPDLDFVPGMLIGNADRFHHGPSHSLFAGLVGGVVLGALVARRAGWPTGRRYGLAFAVGYASHVVLDMFCIDTRPPFGVPLLWPFWDGYLASPVEVFLDIHRDRDTAAFVGSLFQLHNLKAVLWELVVMVTVVAAVGRWRRRRPAGRTVETEV
ncbi:MAG: metal-dependent hydrolase [Candidatus Eiseniibacteriota bacterium]|jgi:inner membrane protein